MLPVLNEKPIRQSWIKKRKLLTKFCAIVIINTT